ncbi:MAG: UbiA family prenyltransferase [Candidatus Thermoplasmatota archaeon]|nr:UbiA family prenyltransferase [Candidatus Thermoplasmatota archaeon]
MVNIKNVLNNVKKWIESIEQSKTPFIFFVLTFLFAVTMRNYFETFSDTPVANLQYYTIANIIEYYIWYSGLAVLITLLFHLATKERIKHIFHLTLPTFLALNIAPLVDIVFSRGKGFDYAYMLPGVHENLIFRWLTYTGEYTGMGATPGMRTGGVVLLFVAFSYLYLKTNKILVSFVYTYAMYSIIFWWGAIPFANRALLQAFDIIYRPTALFTIQFILVFLSPTIFILLYLDQKNKFKQFLKSSSIVIPIHYLLILILGSVIALNLFPTGFILNQENFFQWILASIAVLFTVLFIHAVKLFTYHLTKNETKSNMVPEKTIPLKSLKIYAIIFFAAAIMYATAVDHITVFSIIAVMACSFIYHAPPFRLHKIPFISKIFISLSTIIILFLGYYYITSFYQFFPVVLLLFFLLPFTAALNIIDVEKEKTSVEQKTWSWVSFLGENKAKIVISFFIILAYLLFGFILQTMIMTALFVCFGVVMSVLAFYQKKHSDYLIYGLYILSLIISIYFISITTVTF